MAVNILILAKYFPKKWYGIVKLTKMYKYAIIYIIGGK
jgi:hypothetical protein